MCSSFIELVYMEIFFFIQLSCGSYTFVSYRVVESCGSCVATNPATSRITSEETIDPKQHLTLKLKKLFQDVEIQSK